MILLSRGYSHIVLIMTNHVFMVITKPLCGPRNDADAGSHNHFKNLHVRSSLETHTHTQLIELHASNTQQRVIMMWLFET